MRLQGKQGNWWLIPPRIPTKVDKMMICPAIDALMALPNYEDVSRDIRDRLHQQFKRRGEDEMFATRMLAENVLSDNKLRRVYRSLRSSEELHSRPPTPDNASNEDLFVQNVKDKNLHGFLAVLLYANCSRLGAQAFEANSVFGNVPKISLPVSKEDLSDVFGGRSSDIGLFFRYQKYFCTIIIGFPEDIVLKKGDNWRMPWLSQQRLGKGSYGSVYEVQVAEYHFTENSGLEGTYASAQVIARKDFKFDKKESFDREVQVMKEIRRSADGHKNVLTSFGTLIIEGDKPKFSLFMPKAETDLQKFMAQDNADALPLTLRERRSLISSAMGLADGLDFLHKRITGNGGCQRVCYHMDLKPANVLIFPGHTPSDPQIWKISDFGMSKVKDTPHGITPQEDTLTDFRKHFIRRPGAGTAMASKTVIARDVGTFLPSEAQGNGRTMNEKSDVWSLGCIISLLFTYMEFRATGLEKYIDLRVKYSNLPQDVFYGKEVMTRSYPVNKGVVKQHNILVDAAAKRGSIQKDAVRSMLGFLKDRVFLEEQDKRCGAREVYEKLQQTRREYDACAASEGSEERTKLLSLQDPKSQETWRRYDCFWVDCFSGRCSVAAGQDQIHAT
ncbi:hypothetical protein IL306_010481 [Fusarium sp. DS 682]|nr:hypothetical protein IL306_010481 [Fusarium sp. DS 682]